MRLRCLAGYAIVLVSCLFATGCFSIEQEIFLNADGSGDLVVFISLPDFPEKAGGPTMTSSKSPADTLAEFKKELTSGLSASVTLKQAKQVKQNGVESMYAILHFGKLDDLRRVLANFGKDSLKEGDIGSAPQWSLKSEKNGNKTVFTQSFYLDVDGKAKTDAAANGKAQEKQSPEADKASKEMEEQFKPLLLSIVRMRFVLHAPSPITDNNADIVLNGNTAVWNCSLAAFSKEKKPIEMKASF